MTTVNLKQRVLIVDCERVIADTLAQIFSNEGFEVKAAYDAGSAMAIAERWRPNLAILEILLFDMTGSDCGVQLFARYPDCQIILLYAQVAPHLIERALELKFEVFKKPVGPQTLLTTAQRLLQASS